MSTVTDYTFVPRVAIELPLHFPTPNGFDPERSETWPDVEGRLEFVGGRLLFMPPCGGDQQQTAIDVAIQLGEWQRQHPDFKVGGNEAGMKLGGDVRGADAAIWRARDLGATTAGFPRVPPVLAVEIAGQDDTVELMTEKVSWYLDHGVEVVWLLIPDTHNARVVTREGTADIGLGQNLPAHASLPGLTPLVDDLFRQLLQA